MYKQRILNEYFFTHSRFIPTKINALFMAMREKMAIYRGLCVLINLYISFCRFTIYTSFM